MTFVVLVPTQQKCNHLGEKDCTTVLRSNCIRSNANSHLKEHQSRKKYRNAPITVAESSYHR